MKARILAIVSNTDDACSWYRGCGPLSALEKSEPGVRVTYHTSPNWAELRTHDVLFLLRPCTNGALKLAQVAKDLGVRVWVDWDDDIFSIPETNPNFPTYTNPDIREAAEKIIRLADVVTVATNQLMLRMAGLSKVVTVVPNAFDPVLDKWREPRMPTRMVLWRGSATHMGDLEVFKDVLVQLSKDFPAVPFAFLGSGHSLVSRHLKNRISFPPCDLINYFKMLAALSPEIVIVPLEDNLFNQSKSNIAMLEALYAGAVPVVPNWSSWHGPSPAVKRYDDPKGFYMKMHDLLSKEPISIGLVRETRQCLYGDYSLEFANKLRMLILEGNL